MPQDGSKSAVYRSFFSCDDPKGVADCKTSRKSKAILQKPAEDKVVVVVDHQRKQKNLDMSFSHNEDRKEDMVSKGGATGGCDLHHNQSTTVQLREVSRGAHKLNKVIDNLSKGLSFGSQPKDIAKDLLRGALDLQESLEMLGKLQEASQYMVKLKKNHKEKVNNNGGKLEGPGPGIERTTSDRFGMERTTSDRFGYLNKMAFQKPRLSVDGSSGDCYDELRDVIRESFGRQNLLPKSSVEEKGYFDKRRSHREEKAYFESTKFDFPSSSSSQSSMFHSHEFESFDSSLSRSQEEKTKGSNVIAKLMGLEEFPAKTCQSTMEKEKKDKQLNHYRPTFDIDLPMAREPHPNFQKVVDPRRRRRTTSEELFETLHFEGLVSDKATHGSKHYRHLSNVSDWRTTGFCEDAPPIVIMKPLISSVSFKEELQKQEHIPKEISRKWKMEKAVSPKKVINSKGALNFSEIQRKLQAEMSPLKRLSKYKVEKNACNALQDSDDSLIIVKEIKASSPVKPKMQKKEVIEKKVEKIKGMTPNTKEPKEVDASKSKDAAKHHSVNKPAPTYHKKTEREQNLPKSRVAQHKSTPSKSALEHSQLTASRSPNTRKKNAKYEKGLSTLPSTAKDDMKYRNEDVQSEPSCEDKHEVTVFKIAPPEALLGEVESPLISVTDECSESFHSNSTKLIINDKTEIKSSEEGTNCFSYMSSEEQIGKMGDATRNLLFSNSSFLNQAKDLFNFEEHQLIIVPQTANLSDVRVADSKLLVDCAKELLEHKSLQCAQGARSLAHFIVKKPKPLVSSEHLVGEICEGIADLRSYHKLSSSGERIGVDFLQLVLQKDIWCKGAATGGAWDSGWRCGFSVGEIEEVVIEIENTVFRGIMEDLLTDILG